MTMVKGKEKFALWLAPDTREMVDAHYSADNCFSRSEYIEKAIRFYTGYLSARDAGAFLPRVLADVLEGKLLLINGEVDDNVDPASTLQVVSELIKNGKDFEQLYVPGYSHNLGAEWITRRVFAFFYENCR